MLTFILIIYLHFTVVVLVIIETKNWLSLAKKKRCFVVSSNNSKILIFTVVKKNNELTMSINKNTRWERWNKKTKMLKKILKSSFNLTGRRPIVFLHKI